MAREQRSCRPSAHCARIARRGATARNGRIGFLRRVDRGITPWLRQRFASINTVMSRTSQCRPALVWVLATLLLRAAIPDGYMPAQAGSGLLFELCPSGVPEGFMMAIAKSGHQHHHHGAESGDSHYDATQFPIGHLLSAAIAVDGAWPTESAPAPAPYNEILFFVPESRTPANSRSRDPPA